MEKDLVVAKVKKIAWVTRYLLIKWLIPRFDP